ncbi:MAG: SPOR domain-containing protein [Treponema sp.]|jgi:hypothetical protein|nr:SPOR domain-containing protein [Treponema sp.]
MKKLIILAFIIAASFLLFVGASPWEGSATVAPNGELPATGYYLATNAYPRNTVVDITNLENGKSTRVIVSNTLTSPGLLAIVSRQAGELIGMRAGSVTRIRMIQPTDPMAYMRFTQNMKDGNPEYDSGNVITEDNLVQQVYKDDTYTPPETAKPEDTRRPAPVLPGYIVDEPEWGGEGRLQIVDVPDYLDDRLASAEPDYGDEDISKEAVPKDVEKDVGSKVGERPPVEIVKDLPEYDPDRVWESTELPPKEIVKDVSPWEERTEVAKTLVPVETELKPPPANLYGIDPNDIIPGIVTATPEKSAAVTAAPAPVPSDETITIREIYVDRNLPVNTIDRLDRGKYYVQVAAMSSDLVENTLKQIDRGYAPVVLKGTDNLYRILIGPLNQGESAAVLSRFRSIGYKDAFVRKGS